MDNYKLSKPKWWLENDNINSELQVVIDGVQMDNVSGNTFIGVIINSNFNWRTQVSAT